MKKLLLGLAIAGALVACQNTNLNSAEAGDAPQAACAGSCGDSCGEAEAASCDEAAAAECGGCESAEPVSCEGAAEAN